MTKLAVGQKWIQEKKGLHIEIISVYLDQWHGEWFANAMVNGELLLNLPERDFVDYCKLID